MTRLSKRQIELARRKEEIKRRVYDAGWTFSAIDRQFDLPAKTSQEALRDPNERGERAIAEVLDVHPAALWADRYDPVTLERYSPQPNYDRPATLTQRRKIVALPTSQTAEVEK